MNRQTIAEVVGIIKQSQRRFSPPRHLRIDTEPPPRRISQTAHPFLAIMLVAPRRHRKNSFDRPSVVNQQEHLPIEIDFHVLVAWVLCLRCARTHDCVKILAPKLAANRPPFVFLKSYQSVSPRPVTHL